METHWLRLREKHRTEEAGGALLGGPRQFELEQCVNGDDDDDDNEIMMFLSKISFQASIPSKY